jgi:HSP20 family protein
MGKDVVQVMRALFLPAQGALREALWRPPADVYRCPRGWVVKFDVAGVRPDDVSLSVNGRRLTLRGCRRDSFTEEGHHHYSMEISYSRFERSIELPADVEAARLTTEYRDGMLVVRIETEARP